MKKGQIQSGGMNDVYTISHLRSCGSNRRSGGQVQSRGMARYTKPNATDALLGVLVELLQLILHARLKLVLEIVVIKLVDHVECVP